MGLVLSQRKSIALVEKLSCLIWVRMGVVKTSKRTAVSDRKLVLESMIISVMLDDFLVA